MGSHRHREVWSGAARLLATITARTVLIGLALGSLTLMLLVVGSVVVVSAGGRPPVAPRAVRIRQLPPLASPTPLPSPAAIRGAPVILGSGWEVTEIQLPPTTPALTPVASPPPSPTPVRLTPTPVIRPEPVFVGWPTGGQVTQGFGCTPFYSGIPGTECDETAPWFHDGVDIANLAGAPVRAALTGTVVFAGLDTAGPICGQYQGYGQSVIIAAGQGQRALYAHLSKIEVQAGQAVQPDTLIGAVGATGCTSGPHLHLGLQVDGQVVDPTTRMRDEG